MDFNYTPEEEAFRKEVERFIDENLPKGLDASGAEDAESAFAKLPLLFEWNQKLYEKNWIGFSWPKEVGGGGGDVMQQFILKEVMGRRKAPPLGISMMGLAWVGPSLIAYGTEEQKREHIPPILRGEVQWCTGYSEPGAGSDLASLKCKAEREGDEYVVNGQKIWTSLAMWAQWIILLVRTDFSAAKHKGITCLLVRMDSPGITVKPIKEMNGQAMFAEVFFENVRVPVKNRLGPEGEGWAVTKVALANERSSIAEVTTLFHNLEGLKELARKARRNGRPAIEDPAIRRRLAKIETTLEAMRLTGLRSLTKQLKGDPLGPETSVNKLLRARMEIEIGKLGVEMQGHFGLLSKGSPATADKGRWQKLMTGWPAYVIGGGTPNIQKNVIAERILGLPHDV